METIFGQGYNDLYECQRVCDIHPSCKAFQYLNRDCSFYYGDGIIAETFDTEPANCYTKSTTTYSLASANNKCNDFTELDDIMGVEKCEILAS